MSNISGKYAVVGVAETKVGKRPDASTHLHRSPIEKECYSWPACMKSWTTHMTARE